MGQFRLYNGVRKGIIKNTHLGIIMKKNEDGGVSLDPTRERVRDYVRDMDKRNDDKKASDMRKLSNDTQALTKEHYNRIWGIHVSGPTEAFRVNYEAIDWSK